jgi:hypothetical protein
MVFGERLGSLQIMKPTTAAMVEPRRYRAGYDSLAVNVTALVASEARPRPRSSFRALRQALALSHELKTR